MDRNQVSVPKYPKSFDTWSCCGGRYTRFSGILDHIEHHHFLYRYDVVGYFQNRRGYKYSCDKCERKSFSFYIAVGHFLFTHVEHHMFCLQCSVMHSVESFHNHIEECNLVEREIRSKGHGRT